MTARTPVVIVGAGFAGAATAWALARAGATPGVILEREPVFGAHASGRNAGIVRLAEGDPLIRRLARRSLAVLAALEHDGRPVMRRTGGLTLAAGRDAPALASLQAALENEGTDATLLESAEARTRFPLLQDFRFDAALWCPDEGVVDVHALLTYYLQQARAAGFTLRSRCAADALILDAGRVTAVRTSSGELRADAVVDASGAWAGRLGRAAPLPLQPYRRHLCTTGPGARWHRGSPYVWIWESEFYCRPEADGLLMSPCDATAAPAGTPALDPAIGERLGARLERHAPGLLDVSLRRTWACLRTFAPDHRPFVGADPAPPGLFHVSGLGGFGMMTSAAVGEAAAAVILGRTVDWIDLASLSVTRDSSHRPEAGATLRDSPPTGATP